MAIIILHCHVYSGIYIVIIWQCLETNKNTTWVIVKLMWGIKYVNPGLFVPLHFRSREQKVHRGNFRSCGIFVPWNIRSLELSLLWNFRSLGVNIPRTFVPRNIRSRGTFVPQERTFQELSFLWNCRSMRMNITFAPNVLKHDLKLAINLTIAYSH